MDIFLTILLVIGIIIMIPVLLYFSAFMGAAGLLEGFYHAVSKHKRNQKKETNGEKTHH